MRLRLHPNQRHLIQLSQVGESGCSIDLGFVRQRSGTNWCWAACVQMVVKQWSLNPPDDQPDIVREGLTIGRTVCDSISSERLCGEAIGRLWSRYHIEARHSALNVIGNAAEEEVIKKLKESLCQGVPIQLGYDGGHVVMLYGWTPDASETWFLIRDPDYEQRHHFTAPLLIYNEGLGQLQETWEIQKPEGVLWRLTTRALIRPWRSLRHKLVDIFRGI